MYIHIYIYIYTYIYVYVYVDIWTGVATSEDPLIRHFVSESPLEDFVLLALLLSLLAL